MQRKAVSDLVISEIPSILVLLLKNKQNSE